MNIAPQNVNEMDEQSHFVGAISKYSIPPSHVLRTWPMTQFAVFYID